MSKLEVGVDGVLGVDKTMHESDFTWPYITMYTYSNDHIQWCTENELHYSVDYFIQTYSVKGFRENCHRWYFRDAENATLFYLIWAGKDNKC